MNYQFKLWEAKEREKINWWNTLLAVRRTKGPSKSRGARRLRTGPAPPEAGGGGRGKGHTRPQRRHPLPHCKQASKDFLKFWMVDIRWEGRG